MFFYVHSFIYSVGGGADAMTSSYFTGPNTSYEARLRERPVLGGGMKERPSIGENPPITAAIISGMATKVVMILASEETP